MSKELVFLGMGGTIAGAAALAGDNVGYTAGQIGLAQLLAAIPVLADAASGYGLTCEQIAQVDSKDMEFSNWRDLAGAIERHLARTDVAGVVVTHGTDTLEETAFFLDRALPAALIGAKPVVMTCAMRPATALVPDGPQNILDAVAVATSVGARGVLAVCGGTVHSARAIQKVHPYRLDAFDSGDAGPLGFVEEGRVRWVRGWSDDEEGASASTGTPELSGEWPRVEILMSYAGATGATVRALCAQPSAHSPVRGLVVAGTGNGTIHKDLEEALHEVSAMGVAVVRTTRCSYGQVVPSKTENTAFDQSHGLSAVKARIALMLDLMGEKKGR